LGENSPESTLAPGPFSPGLNYLYAWAKRSLPGRNWTREHLLGFQVTSPERDCLAWAKKAKKTSGIHYLRVNMHA